MSKKILGIGLVIVGIALQAIPGIGQAIGLPMIAAGISSAAVIGLTLTIAGSFLMGPSKPKALASSATERLTATLDPLAPRKIVFGRTAMATDARYQAFTGAKQEYLEQIVCNASHEVESIDELWLDNEIAWTVGGGAQGRYAGFLEITPVVVGTPDNGIAIDDVWTASCTLTGCAYFHLRALLIHEGSDGSNDSPFASGVTSRMTVRGKGAKTYDPALDDTVEAGSGPHRADDQATWTWDDERSRNPALQELWYELGWRINGKLAVGKGVPKERIDLASFAVAANMCDETVTKNGGGTEPRYRSDGIVSERDDPGAVRDNLCASMNALLRDDGGKLSLSVLHNDLATPVTPFGRTAFDARDIIADIDWEPTLDLKDTFNIVRGTKVDPSDQALYQMVDFPEVKIDSPDGIDRIDSVEYRFVESNGQAQRLAKQRLQRNQFPGRVSFVGLPSFLGVSLGKVFPLSHPAFEWEEKLFRCSAHKPSRMGSVEIVAVEEAQVLYQWDNDEAPAVVAPSPTIYDPANHPVAVALAAAAKQVIASSTARGLGEPSIAADGSITIVNHFRRYADKEVPVTGAVIASGAAAGDFVVAYYDDPGRLGGAVVYQVAINPAAVGDYTPSPAHPSRIFITSGTVPASGTSGGSSGGGSGGYQPPAGGPYQ